MVRTPHTDSAAATADAGSASGAGHRSEPSCPENAASTTTPSSANRCSTRRLKSAWRRGTCTAAPTTNSAPSASAAATRIRRRERVLRWSGTFVINGETRTLGIANATAVPLLP
ncbi:MAG TPA: hypothetical protein DCQ52_13565 [Acidimicrobiaceae bacterium]|nr:hypothetical protein [Acidimicrobiaceae bacterium]